jgi:hypothetical protein
MDRQETGEDVTERRPFLLIDAITLVAAAALMLPANRALHWLWWWGDPLASYSERNTRVMVWTLALIGLSLALLPSQLVRSADRRRLRRGVPGLFVHGAVVTVLGLRIAGWAAQASIAHSLRGAPGVYQIWWTRAAMNYLLEDFRFDAVIGVAACWLTLAIAGRWRPERAWDDRLGRFIGILWLIFYLGAPMIGLLP